MRVSNHLHFHGAPTKMSVLESFANKDKHTVGDIMSTGKYRIPPPTIFFLKPDHLRAVVDGILTAAKKSFLFRFAWRHKLAAISEGFITKDSLWDRLVFDGARAKVVGDAAGTLRNVVVSGGMLCICLPGDCLTLRS
jgi:long-chain acyl-CoA synthetase